MKKRILITGSSGLLGKNLCQILKKKYHIIELNSKNCDLLDPFKTEKFFLKSKPYTIIHAANKVYGITGNKSNEFSLLNDNLLINTNVLNATKKCGAKKIIFISTSAVFSEKFKNKISEKNFMKFEPHKSELYYGLSKRIFY